MAFVDKIIGPDEKLVGISTVHWIYAVQGIMWMTGFLILGLWLDSLNVRLHFAYPGNPGLIATTIMANAAFYCCVMLGLLLFAFYLVMIIATEVAITNKRIIYKRGLIFVRVSETDLEEIKAADVDNGWFGRFLNYGYIQLDARFINNVSFPAVADPYRFVKAVNEIRNNLRDDSMTVVLQGHGEPQVVDENKAGEAPTEKKDEPEHKLDDPRYAALSNSPHENVQDMKSEAKQGLERARQKAAPQIEELAPSENPTAPQQEQPKSVQETKPQPQTAEPKTSGPIIFEKENLREHLKEKIIDSFSDAGQASP